MINKRSVAGVNLAHAFKLSSSASSQTQKNYAQNERVAPLVEAAVVEEGRPEGSEKGFVDMGFVQDIIEKSKTILEQRSR